MVRIIITASFCFLSALSFGAEFKVALGIGQSSVVYRADDPALENDDHKSTAPFFALGLKNNIDYAQKHWLGAGVDFEKIDGMQVTGFRALDYQWRFSPRWHTGAFIGAASIDNIVPQNGYYYGAHFGLFALKERLSVDLEWRHGEGLARDKQPGEPSEGRPDIFMDYSSFGLQASWNF